MPETHELIAAASDQLNEGKEPLEVLTWLAYAVERETVRSLVGVPELSRALGVGYRRARRIAEQASARGIGRKLDGWVFTGGEVRRLAAYRDADNEEVAHDEGK